jgi:HK97 gp10 family phage protein
MSRRNTSLEELNRRFAAMGEAARHDVRAELDKGADRIVALSRSLAPVDDGDLRDSIQKKDGEHREQVLVTAGDEKAFYAGFIEHGAGDRLAQPYFFPAYRALKRSITGRVNKVMRDAAKRKAGV